MDSEASGDRTKDEAVLVYEAAAQLLFRYKKHQETGVLEQGTT